MMLVYIRTKRPGVLDIACAIPLSSNLLFAAEKNKEAAHTTRHLARVGVVCTHFQDVCGDMSGQEPSGGIRLRNYWWWWHNRTVEKGSRRANTLLGLSYGAIQANTFRYLGNMLLKQQFSIYITPGPWAKNNSKGGTLCTYMLI